MAGLGPLGGAEVFGGGDSVFGAEAEFSEEPLHDEPILSSSTHDEPPPYHSVVLDPPPTSTVPPAAQPTAVVYGAPHNPDFDISVSDPVKQGEGVAAHVSYKVVSRTQLPGYRGERTEVIRRFRDFVWLQHRLRAEFRGVIVPALPEKNVVEKYKMTTDFIEQRRAALAVFLRRVAAHPALRTSPDLRLFLEANETEFGIEMSRTQVVEPAGAAGGAKKAVTGAVRFLRDLSHSAQNLYQRRTDDEEEDPEYLKVRAYVYDLERHLSEAHRQAGRLVRHQAELGGAIAEFGGAMVSLGRYEESGGVGDSFAALGERAEAISRLCRTTSDRLATGFEAPLKEFTRMVKAARKVMADRSAALAAYQAARGEVDNRRVRLAKLRGTPGIREEKVAEAERELNEAQHRADAAKAAYETIVHRMGGELDRFQRERSQEMSVVLREFALVEAQMSANTAQLWRSLVPGLEVGAA